MRINYPSPTQEGQLRELWRLAFGDSEEFIDLFFEAGYQPEHCRCVTVAEKAAAALYWFDTECDGQKFAYLYAVATHPEYRNRGLCRWLMEDTHALLKERGYDGALLTPAELPLRQMYAGMGYNDCCTVAEFSAEAGVPVLIREIGREEYAALRRQYLPEGGVIQEGRNLHFLEGFARFYKGGDFLLAAAVDGKTLRGLELLGNKQAAPGILGALGYAEGIYRSPGEDFPFTMFRPLKMGVKAPSYFGLAFD